MVCPRLSLSCVQDIAGIFENANREILQRKYACVANVECFEKLEDSENKKLRAGQQGKETQEPKTSSHITYHVTISGKQLHIAYSLSSDSQLRFVLSNTSGMLLKSFNQYQPAGDGYEQVIDLAICHEVNMSYILM